MFFFVPQRTQTACLFLALLATVTSAACDTCGGVAPPPPGPVITDATVRSCDIVLRLDGDEVPAVEFADSVRGQSIPQAPQLAISFAARADASLQGSAPFVLRFKGSPVPASIVKETCFDATGKAVEGTPVTLP